MSHTGLGGRLREVSGARRCVGGGGDGDGGGVTSKSSSMSHTGLGSLGRRGATLASARRLPLILAAVSPCVRGWPWV